MSCHINMLCYHSYAILQAGDMRNQAFTGLAMPSAISVRAMSTNVSSAGCSCMPSSFST